MPETEAPWHIGLAHQVDAQKLVQCAECLRIARPGGRGSELGIEGIARDGCPFEHEARLGREQAELLRDRRSHDRWNLHAAE